MPTAITSAAIPQPPKPWVRALVSVLVILHVGAVFVGPWATPPQTSELAAGIAQSVQPYSDLLSLSNGYRFFAPEPGPSHLIRYEVTMSDGSTKQGTFPDRNEQKPRLLYHRYFMMSEFINTLSNPAMPRDRVEAYANSYAEHLADTYQGKSVKLFLRRHYVPRMTEVREGRRLNDKVLYEERLLGVFERDKT